jgi:hypothetical protein
MGIKKILALTTLGFVSVLGATQPGFALSISEKGVNTFNAIATPYVFGLLKNVEVPSQNITGGSLTNIHFTLDSPPKPEDIQFLLNPATNGIQFNTNELTAHVTADFSFSYLFIEAKGTAKIDITGISADLGIDQTTQPGTPSGLGLAIKTRDIELKILQDNITIDLEGDGVVKIADLIKPLIKAMIAN